MSDDAVPPGTPQEVALQTILRSIAVRDRSTAARLLAGSPALARQALDVGATRAEESPYYFEELDRDGEAVGSTLTLRPIRTW